MPALGRNRTHGNLRTPVMKTGHHPIQSAFGMLDWAIGVLSITTRTRKVRLNSQGGRFKRSKAGCLIVHEKLESSLMITESWITISIAETTEFAHPPYENSESARPSRLSTYLIPVAPSATNDRVLPRSDCGVLYI